MTDLERTIHNERVKFGAAALDRLSTGCYLVGAITPPIQHILAISSGERLDYGRFWTTFILFVFAVIMGFFLHAIGHRTLKDLQ